MCAESVCVITRSDQMFMRPPTPPDASARPSGLKARVLTGVMWPFSWNTHTTPSEPLDRLEHCCGEEHTDRGAGRRRLRVWNCWWRYRTNVAFQGGQGLRKGKWQLVLPTHVLANTEVCVHEWVRGGFCYSTLSLAFGSFSQHPSEPEEENSGKLEASWGTVQTETRPFWQHLKPTQTYNLIHFNFFLKNKEFSEAKFWRLAYRISHVQENHRVQIVTKSTKALNETRSRTALFYGIVSGLA